MKKYIYFDTHTHYDWEEFDNDREALLTKLGSTTLIVNIGCNIQSCKESIAYSKKYKNMFHSLGIHPMNVENKEKLEIIENLINDKTVAIGETGLDLKFPNLTLQKEYFLKHIDLANKYNLPIIIHCRKMHNEVYEILKENKVLKKGIMHCYSGDKEHVKKFLGLGYYFGFDGPITKSNKYDEIIEMIPIDKIVVETDAPLMVPAPLQETRSDSSMLNLIIKKISEIKKTDYETVKKQVFINALNIYNIKND